MRFGKMPKLFEKNSTNPLKRGATCVMITLGCEWLVQNKRSAHGQRYALMREVAGLFCPGFSAEYVRS